MLSTRYSCQIFFTGFREVLKCLMFMGPCIVIYFYSKTN